MYNLDPVDTADTVDLNNEIYMTFVVIYNRFWSCYHAITIYNK